MEYEINLPFTNEQCIQLKAGDLIYLTGTIYTARDAAHKRLVEMIDKGETLPFDLKDQVIYYVGPTPTAPGQVIGSCGPTTSGRMDAYAPILMAHGLKAMIGKGYRNDQVKTSMRQHQALYLGALGGCGALISKSIISSKIIAFEDLGAEAIRQLEVDHFPCYVLYDTEGNDLYLQGPKDYLNHEEA